MIQPAYLKAGSVVRIVSTAGVVDAEIVQKAASCLQQWGLVVQTGSHAAERVGRFAGTPEQRLSDLQEALDDPSVEAVFCSRGGYGTIHLMDKLSWTAFQKHPKWIIGFSDITMLHSQLNRMGYQSIHGGMAKMLAESLIEPGEPARQLNQLLFGAPCAMQVEGNLLNKQGLSQGRLIGGNLSILYSLRATPFDVNPDKNILFIEDIGEKPYAIDRMMYNLRLSGFLENLSGLVVGQFSDYEEDPLMGKTVQEIVREAVAAYNYPVAFGFPVGHTSFNLPLICGATVALHVGTDGATLSYIKP